MTAKGSVISRRLQESGSPSTSGRRCRNASRRIIPPNSQKIYWAAVSERRKGVFCKATASASEVTRSSASTSASCCSRLTSTCCTPATPDNTFRTTPAHPEQVIPVIAYFFFILPFFIGQRYADASRLCYTIPGIFYKIPCCRPIKFTFVPPVPEKTIEIFYLCGKI